MNRRTTALTLLIGTLLPGAPALASDMGPPPELRPSTFDIYLGAFGAANVLTSTYRETNDISDRDMDGMNAGIGLRGGVDYLTGSGWVFGAVADWTFGGDIAEDEAVDARLSMPNLNTFRLRAGGHWGDTMLYVTGGYAQAEMVFASRYAGVTEESSGWAKGWTLGAGANYALTDSLSIGLEYLFVDLGDIGFDQTDSLGTSYRYDMHFDGIHTLRLGLDYAFHI